MRKPTKPKEKTLGERLLEDMEMLIRENIYPAFHARVKPIFAEHPDIAKITISTERDYNGEYYEMFSLDECKITISDTAGTTFYYDTQAFGYSDEGRCTNWRNAALSEDDWEDEDSEAYDENDDPTDLPASFEPAIDSLLDILRQFDIAQTALVFGVDGTIELTPDSITVSGDYPDIENPNY